MTSSWTVTPCWSARASRRCNVSAGRISRESSRDGRKASEFIVIGTKNGVLGRFFSGSGANPNPKRFSEAQRAACQS